MEREKNLGLRLGGRLQHRMRPTQKRTSGFLQVCTDLEFAHTYAILNIIHISETSPGEGESRKQYKEG